MTVLLIILVILLAGGGGLLASFLEVAAWLFVAFVLGGVILAFLAYQGLRDLLEG